jgi:hypothetical protein
VTLYVEWLKIILLLILQVRSQDSEPSCITLLQIDLRKAAKPDKSKKGSPNLCCIFTHAILVDALRNLSANCVEKKDPPRTSPPLIERTFVVQR